MERRLAAILAADMVGYSRLMAADEAGTIARQRGHRGSLIDPKIAQFGGRLVKSTGDGVLVEFPSVVDAAQCAIEVQRAMLEREKAESEDRRIRYRIGVNLGDIVFEDGDIFGDGVNIAARLEGIAPPGGVCVSDIVYQNLRGKLDPGFSDMGEQSLKNMERKVRAWFWQPSGEAPKPRLAAKTNLPLPDRPSIAVLPFNNMSGDPEQSFFADGIAEDLITALSKVRTLFVIARNSSFTFRAEAVNLKEVSQKLGVRYVVEGSVRRAGNRLRITAQLIDAIEDKHIWAERYDRELADIFEIQDEVTEAIVRAIAPELTSSEQKRALRKPPESLDAWESYQRGMWHISQYDPAGRETTIGFMRRAVALDPSFALAHAGLSYALYMYVVLGVSENLKADLDEVFKEAKEAVRLDPQEPFAWVCMARARQMRGEPELAVEAADKAIELNPNMALAHFGRAHALWHAGRPAEALKSHEKAIRLSPNDPAMSAFLASKAIALSLLERYDEALETARASQNLVNPAIFSYFAEITTLGHLGRIEEAREAIERARRFKPDLSLSYIQQVLPVGDPAARERFHDGFRKAGLED